MTDNCTEPPELPIKSIQYDLFSQFISNDKEAVSNTIEIWDKIPKYFLTAKQIEKHCPPSGHPDPYRWSYHDEYDQEWTVVIQPAFIEQTDGSYKAYFPMVTEGLVEEALKKILSDQNYGIHDPSKHETWVRFTLSMLHRELKRVGRSRTRPQIKQAIAVLSRCLLTLHKGKKEVWTGNILQDLVTVDREVYLEDTHAYHVARLPLFISHAIDRLEIRQFNYDRLMRCKSQLSIWIYKQIIHRYRQASFTNDYHFKYSTLAHSGLLQHSEHKDNRKKIIAALKELVKQDVLLRYEFTSSKTNNKIIDVVYTIFPSQQFVAEQKAANKRNTDNYHIALNQGWSLPSVDKQRDKLNKVGTVAPAK